MSPTLLPSCLPQRFIFNSNHVHVIMTWIDQHIPKCKYKRNPVIRNNTIASKGSRNNFPTSLLSLWFQRWFTCTYLQCLSAQENKRQIPFKFKGSNDPLCLDALASRLAGASVFSPCVCHGVALLPKQCPPQSWFPFETVEATALPPSSRPVVGRAALMISKLSLESFFTFPGGKNMFIAK